MIVVKSSGKIFHLPRAPLKMSDVLLTGVSLFANRRRDRNINRVKAVRLATSIG